MLMGSLFVLFQKSSRIPAFLIRGGRQKEKEEKARTSDNPSRSPLSNAPSGYQQLEDCRGAFN
jgi:hypothetical protein